MKLVLLSDVKALGKLGEIVDVAEGYANNFLLPRKLAVEANKSAMAVLEAQKRAQNKREAASLAEAQTLAERLAAAKIAVSAKAGGNGKLFGAVTNADVADAIHRELDVTVDRHKIEIMSSIKALGSYPVEIKLHKNVVAKATLSVVAA